MTHPWAINIDKSDIRSAQIVADAHTPLVSGQVRVSVDSYAMTANNVTYAVFGEPSPLFPPDANGNPQGYWDFFGERDAPGRLPIWGFATVIESACDGVDVGATYYGYYPMASRAVLTPKRVSAHGFVDATPRRTALPIIYNQYQRLEALGDYRADHHDYWPIFRPLFLTGWLIADQFEEMGDYGAAQIIIASASSKTAIGLGHCIAHRDGPRPRTIGLTSAGSVVSLAASGVYDQVISYGDVATLDAAVPSALVDMAGNPAVTATVHGHFADQMLASIVVGKSHWDVPGSGFGSGDASLLGARPQGFFAPARSEKRVADWGGAGFAGRIAAAWLGFMDRAPALAQVDVRNGAEAALAAYTEMVDGRADPKSGIVVRP